VTVQHAAVRDDGAGRWLPPVIVVVVIAVVVGGGQVLQHSVAPPDGGVVRIGAVQLRPRPGWDVGQVTTAPASARLHRGPVVLDVVASSRDATGPASLAVRYLDGRRSTLPQLLPATPELIVLPSGASAARIGYVGVTADGLPIEGVVTAVGGMSTAAIFDAAAPRGELIGVADDLQAMVDEAIVP
jgi:hypothetical protein